MYFLDFGRKCAYLICLSSPWIYFYWNWCESCLWPYRIKQHPFKPIWVFVSYRRALFGHIKDLHTGDFILYLVQKQAIRGESLHLLESKSWKKVLNVLSVSIARTNNQNGGINKWFFLFEENVTKSLQTDNGFSGSWSTCDQETSWWRDTHE